MTDERRRYNIRPTSAGSVMGRLVSQLGPVSLTGTATLSATLTTRGSLATSSVRGGTPAEQPIEPAENYPTVLLQATIVKLGNLTDDGPLVESVSTAWFEIVRELGRNRDFLFEMPWRRVEELIAGAYEREGWPEVVLTPRSGDHGRDVIATRPGFGSIRIVDQVKAYAPGHRVTADEVRSMLGTLVADANVSKGIVTTSAEFAPGVLSDPRLRAFMPHRLELKGGHRLLDWLTEILKRGRG